MEVKIPVVQAEVTLIPELSHGRQLLTTGNMNWLPMGACSLFGDWGSKSRCLFRPVASPSAPTSLFVIAALEQTVAYYSRVRLVRAVCIIRAKKVRPANWYGSKDCVSWDGVALNALGCLTLLGGPLAKR
jgi:hypothetical protein